MTTNTLSRIENTTADDLQAISRLMDEYVATENDAVLQTALQKINERPSLFRRLFPTAYEKQQQVAMLEMMRSIAKSKEELFRIYTGVQIEIARKQGDALIASVGMALQA